MHPIFHKYLDKLYNEIELDDILIMESMVHNHAADDPGIVQKITDPETIINIYNDTERWHSERGSIIESRIHHGLDFFTFSLDGKIIATTWVIHNHPRFIDEVAIDIEPIENSLWIRDTYTIKNQRGKNIFSRFLYKIIEECYTNKIERLFSDISKSNISSLRAHQKYGFKTILSIYYINLFNKLIIRKIPKTSLNITIYHEGRSILVINSNFKNYVQEHIA